MKTTLVLVVLCILCLPAICVCSDRGDRGDHRPFKGDRFSIIALPFRYNGIVPEFIDSAPTELLQVNWPSGVSARLGNELTPTQTQDHPLLSWTCDPGSYYTLVMIACDVLGQRNRLLSEGRLWLVGNIHNCKLNQGETLTEMLSPTPLYGSGIHRYVLLMYKQKGKIEFEEPHVESRDTENRFYTSQRHFEVKYNLGKPVAGNLFTAQWDPYSDVVFAGFKQPFPKYVSRAIVEANLPQRARFVHDYWPNDFEEVDPSQFETYDEDDLQKKTSY